VLTCVCSLCFPIAAAGLSPEQQTFIVLADTVLKQLDSCKAAEAGVGGPVRRCAEFE
jgi:hypothetical protein